jgi:hypothetical protein
VTAEESLPSFVGFTPIAAEEAARQLGVTLVWVEASPPHWLSPRNEPRVARQRLREDGTLELLCVRVPILNEIDDSG